MKDRYKREISYMRISLTDRCNFRCLYCMPEAGIEKCSHDDIISLEEVEKIVRAAATLGIKKIRLTGGEPLVRKGIVSLCEKISKIPGIEEICLTTNGALFKNYAKDLKDAGVSRINFSLDTLDPEKFKKISRGGDLKETLAAIDEAIKLGFKVKINAVLIGGFNIEDIENLVAYTKDHDIQVRFIELMKMGQTIDWEEDKFVSNNIVLEKLPKLEAVKTDGVAKVYRLPGYKGTVGLISPISSCFCQDCNRIRLTADGKLKPCLHSNREISLRGLEGEDLLAALKEGTYEKDKSHHLVDGTTATKRFMNTIGG